LSLALTRTRLIPDTLQLPIACDTAKGAAMRLAAIDIPKHEDTQTTLAELDARISKIVAAAQLQGAETRSIELKSANGSIKFTGLAYLTESVLLHFYFHTRMVYAMLRKGSVDVGKKDFIGPISWSR